MSRTSLPLSSCFSVSPSFLSLSRGSRAVLSRGPCVAGEVFPRDELDYPACAYLGHFSFVTFLIPYPSTLRNIQRAVRPSSGRAACRSVSRLLCQLASPDISRLSTSCQRSQKRRAGEISGFRRRRRVPPFSFHTLHLSVVARLALTMYIRRRCFVVLHLPSSMSFCFFIHRCPHHSLPSINISFHLSGSNASA